MARWKRWQGSLVTGFYITANELGDGDGEADDAYENQVDCHDVVEQFWKDQNEDAGDDGADAVDSWIMHVFTVIRLLL